ncbi:E3 SUMO-protein ligase PIAS2-like [Metopolophium dirhodum]|uniref:E3 SUMO-protein ligase PIAS2-like n=1 Tax=Metopolophium dirhodum TaxID=44670 RepID=UPI0029906CEE|nr:E3 SUMO-protein ligase PIAS2-like [Metopolophium dirhodum]XP_060857944.1 E3 SUMO-protein ligase PIAS2-like [Metopolophium dirhodum]XP_060857945.1 E3 SUMO-protein ligase PIAS2-like [Metopolophium dirhodum]
MANQDYQIMLDSFQTNHLKILLGAFGRSIAGRKFELKYRVLELLRSKSPGFNRAEFISKIHEIFRSMVIVMPKNNAIMKQGLLQTQQRQMTGQIQAPQQRMYQPAPLYPQQPMNMTRGESPQVMPQIQRGIYCNPVRANTIANNNIQYTSGSYQPSGPRSITSSNLSSSQQMNVVSQDPLGYDMRGMTVGNNSYTPSPETVAQIKFKKLPFYEVIDVVLKPTFLAGTNKCSFQNVPKGMKEAEFKLFVPTEAINIVAMNRDISSGKQDYPYQFQIRISQLVEPMSNEVTDFMPLGLHIRLDGKTCPLPPKTDTRPGAESRRSPRPINCTQLVKLSPITPNIIKINWVDTLNYVMSMYLVKRISSETLIQRLQDKGGRNSEETKKYIIEKLADVDPDLATTSYRFSLVCPLSKTRMKIPAKSIHCDHLQCFDASTFILMNEKKPTWMCPTCNKACMYDDLQIENYFLEVVSSPKLKESSKEIEFLADGTWIVFKEKKKTKTTNSTFNANLKPINFVNLDSDEDISVDLKVEHSSETVKHQENVNLNVVDLTLSDDEEEPPKQKIKQENEAQASDAIQPVAIVDSKPQAQVQPQQATSSEQGVVIEIDSPSPPSSPISTTEAS